MIACVLCFNVSTNSGAISLHFYFFKYIYVGLTLFQYLVGGGRRGFVVVQINVPDLFAFMSVV